MIEKNREPSPRELRLFGLMFAGFFGLVGLLVRLRGGALATSVAIWATAGTVAVLYYALPSARRWFYRLWIRLVYPIGWVTSHLALGLVYYVVVTPIGLLARLRDPMRRTLEPSATTYWIVRRTARDPDRYFRQY
jgi:hypothetical protein